MKLSLSKLTVLICAVLSLFLYGYILSAKIIPTESHTEQYPTNTPSIEETPEVQSTSTYASEYNSEYSSQPVAQPTEDPDPIIDCNSKELGTMRIRRSECVKGIACEVDGKWHFASSQAECVIAQNSDQQIQDNEQSKISQCVSNASEAKIICLSFCTDSPCRITCDDNYRSQLDVCYY